MILKRVVKGVVKGVGKRVVKGVVEGVVKGVGKRGYPLFGLLLVLVLATATATTYLELSLEEMFDKADLAFFGEVTASESEAREGEPWTLVTFNVARDLRGDLEAEEITLAFYGGSADGVTVNVTDMPQFRRGEEVLILAYDAEYYSPIVGFVQGLWRLEAQGFTDVRGRVLTLELPSEDAETTDSETIDGETTDGETTDSETIDGETTDGEAILPTLLPDGEGSDSESVLAAFERALAGRP